MSEPGSTTASEPAGYYGQPAIHGPHWNWLIIGYFYTGGISGGAAALAAAAGLFGDERSERLRDHAVLVSFAALLPCPIFLILDLGRPERFHHMVKAFRPSSPMSMGTWGLTLFSVLETLCALAVVCRWLTAGRLRLPRLAEKTLLGANGAAGLFLAGYTGALLAATAVPLWSRRPGLLGPLFLSSAVSSGCAATALSLHARDGTGHESDALTVIDAATGLGKAGLLAAWVTSLGDVAGPVETGRRGRIVREGCILAGVVAPLAIEAATGRSPRWARAGRIVAASLSLAGTFALRYAVVSGGRASAADPQATFNVTR